MQCPDPGEVAPQAIGGADAVRTLTSRLAGPDRENVIGEAVHSLRARDPSLSQDAIADILIAADCPNVAGDPSLDGTEQTRRISELRSQIEAVLAVVAPEESPQTSSGATSTP
jgi:hypothetical protein